MVLMNPFFRICALAEEGRPTSFIPARVQRESPQRVKKFRLVTEREAECFSCAWSPSDGRREELLTGSLIDANIKVNVLLVKLK